MWIDMLSKLVLVISAAAWFFVGLLSGPRLTWPIRICMMSIGVIGLTLLSCPEFFYPEEGPTMLPTLDNTIPRGNIAMQLTGLPPHVKVLYWTAATRGGQVTTTTSGGVANVTVEGEGKAKCVNRLGIDEVIPKYVYFRTQMNGSTLFSRVYRQEIISAC